MPDLDPFVQYQKFFDRFDKLKQDVSTCLLADGKDPKAEEKKASDELARSLGKDPDAYVIGTADLVIGGGFPKQLDWSYRTFVQLVGGQPLVGSWSVLQMDLLTIYEDGAAIVSQSIPSIVSEHPNADILKAIGSADLLTYRAWVNGAAGYCEELRKQAERDVANGNFDRAADLASSQALCNAYNALSRMAD